MSTDRDTARAPRSSERGSALLTAIFVLTVLTVTGSVLLFLSESEMKMNQADHRGKQAYFLAEAGLEHARAQLWDDNRADSFQDDLDDAKGADTVLDFDRTTILPTFGTDGDVTGFTGFGDDDPVADLTTLATGMYIAFLTNDPVEGEASPDIDGRVMLTSVGAGQDGSFEMVQAIVEVIEVLPTIPPATITLLGPTPVFNGGNSKVKDYIGSDCNGAGIPNHFMPVVGAVGAANVLTAEAGITGNPDYESGDPPGSISDLNVFADLEDTGEPTVGNAIDPTWSDCASLNDMVETLQLVADYTCSGTCTIPAGPPGQIIAINGDISLAHTESGYGTLLVTGELTATGKWSWDGLIMIVGEGQFRINGAGNGTITGGMIMADIAGADNVYGTADDCTSGNASGVSVYDESGGGNAGTIYCTTSLIQVNPAEPYAIEEFIQR